jgi:hypothetical protein
VFGSYAENFAFYIDNDLYWNMLYPLNVVGNDGTTLTPFNYAYTTTPGFNFNYSIPMVPTNHANWQQAGWDVHGQTNNPNLNAGYAPMTPSAAIGNGANLSAFFTTDMAGNPRPATGAWDIGAFQHQAAPLPPVNGLVIYAK